MVERNIPQEMSHRDKMSVKSIMRRMEKSRRDEILKSLAFCTLVTEYPISRPYGIFLTMRYSGYLYFIPYGIR